MLLLVLAVDVATNAKHLAKEHVQDHVLSHAHQNHVAQNHVLSHVHQNHVAQNLAALKNHAAKKAALTANFSV